MRLSKRQATCEDHPLACNEAPEAHERWNLRLLADKVVEMGYCKKVFTRDAYSVSKSAVNSFKIQRFDSTQISAQHLM
jgi:hypothetical protein